MRWFWVAFMGVACSSSPSNELSPVDAGHKTDARAEVAVEAEPPFVCDACSTELSGEPVPPNWHCIKTLDAEVVELDGRPIEGVTIMACSPLRCMHNDSDVDGKVHLEQCTWLTQPSFRVIGFEKFVQFAVPMRNPTTEFSFTKVPLVRLPEKGVTIEAGKAQKLTQNGATLELVAGEKNIVVDELGAYADFRAAEVPTDRLLPGLDGGHGFGVVYELGPQNTELSPPAKLTVPNRKGWAPGTAVELYLQNFDTVKDAPVEIGMWYRACDGKVSDDGASIVTDTGIPRLGLVGVRKKP